MRIVQLVPAFSRGDAIGEDALALDNHFRTQGIESWIETPDIKTPHPSVREMNLKGLASLKREDVVIYHTAVATPYAEDFLQLKARKVVINHNITPPEYYRPFAPEIAELLEASLRELRAFVENKEKIDLFIGDSDFNSRMIREMGAQAVTVPLAINWERFRGRENPYFRRIFADHKINFLFVGRVVPNKKIEDLIRFVFYFKEMINPAVRLIVAGNYRTLPKYAHCLQDLAYRFHLSSDEVVFTGWVEEEELRALYRAAHVFVSASEHEGFGAPFLEAFEFSLPVLAFKAGAIPETVGRGGILMEDKNPALWGEVANLILEDGELRSELLKGGKERLSYYKSLNPPQMLLNLIKEL